MDLIKIKSFYKARHTLFEMLKDRGYDIPEKLIISIEEFTIQYENENIDIGMKIGDKNTYVYFHIREKNLAKKDFISLVERVEKNYGEDVKLIIISVNKLNQSLNKEIHKMDNCESFLLGELQFNITHHILIPEIRLLNSEEIDKVVKKFKVPVHKLAKFLPTDPIVKYYGAKPGRFI